MAGCSDFVQCVESDEGLREGEDERQQIKTEGRGGGQKMRNGD